MQNNTKSIIRKIDLAIQKYRDLDAACAGKVRNIKDSIFYVNKVNNQWNGINISGNVSGNDGNINIERNPLKDRTYYDYLMDKNVRKLYFIDKDKGPPFVSKWELKAKDQGTIKGWSTSQKIKYEVRKALPWIPFINIANDFSEAISGKDLMGYELLNEEERQNAKFNAFIDVSLLGIGSIAKEFVTGSNSIGKFSNLEEYTSRNITIETSEAGKSNGMEGITKGVSKTNTIPDEFYKLNGGMEKGDFITNHAEKHLYNPDAISTMKKTQFEKDVDILKLREDTMLHPDSIVYNDEHNVIKYIKEYDFNISTLDTPTGKHRVFINLDPKPGKTNRNSQFPLYEGDK